MSEKKSNNLQRYAFIALIVAALACIGSGVIALMLGLNTVGWFTPPNIDIWKRGFWISVTLIGIGIGVYGILVPDRIRRFLSGRQARYGSNSLILTVAMLSILVMVNILAYQNPKSWDLTEDKTHTLAPETISALKQLPDKVNAVAFYTPNLPTTQAQELLQNFKINSDGKFDYRFVNPDTDPVGARQAGITGDGKIMLVMGDHHEIAASADETELVRTLIRLINPEARAVYFLTGHGEPDITTSGDTTMSIAKSTLESKNYTVNTLNLLSTNKIPADALAIIVAGPLKPLTPQEVDLLKMYVDAGGGLIVMEDPLPLTDFGTAADPLADYLKSDWGILLNNDLIIDLTNSISKLFATTASLSSTHPITQNMTKVVILPNARSLSIDASPKDVTVTDLAQTSDQSWGETDFESLKGQVQFDQAADVPGPLTMAVAGENSATKGRVVVFGNASFAFDTNFDALGNGAIFINSVDWAATQENLIQITPHTAVERTFNAPTQIQWIIILLGSVFILPGLVVIAGFTSWLARRRRG